MGMLACSSELWGHIPFNCFIPSSTRYYKLTVKKNLLLISHRHPSDSKTCRGVFKWWNLSFKLDRDVSKWRSMLWQIRRGDCGTIMIWGSKHSYASFFFFPTGPRLQSHPLRAGLGEPVTPRPTTGLHPYGSHGSTIPIKGLVGSVDRWRGEIWFWRKKMTKRKM